MKKKPASYADTFRDRIPYAVDSSANHCGLSWVPASTFDIACACSILAGRFECCPHDIWPFPETEVVCSCDARRDAGSCRSRLGTDLDPSECGACWRSLMEWLGDPYRKVHELIALDTLTANTAKDES